MAHDEGGRQPGGHLQATEERVRQGRFPGGRFGKDRQVAAQGHPGDEMGLIKEGDLPIPDPRHQLGGETRGLLEGELFLVIQEEDGPPVQFGEFDEQSQTELHHIFHKQQGHGRGAGLL
jgi:hypothetical protein